MHEVSITGLNRISQPRPNKAGCTILAFFDCEANGFAMNGCAFVRTPRQGLTVWPPKLEANDHARRSVAIADERLRTVMVRQAQASYRALGGTDGEWMPHDPDDTIRRTANREEAARRMAVKQHVETPVADEDAGLHRFLSNGAE